MASDNQHKKILDYIKAHGSISPMEAFEHLRITKLATRVSEMIRLGIPIEKVPDFYINANGEKSKFMRYRRPVQ